MSSPTPARLAAYETLRRVFEEEAWADRALRSAASREHLAGRERAQAQALAYGSVQRRGTTDHFIAELAGRPVEKIDRPLLAALRLGMFELLFSTGHADHAAVDQAVALAKGPSGRRRGSGLVNAVLRRAAREQDGPARRRSATTIRTPPRSPIRCRRGSPSSGGRSSAPSTRGGCSRPSTCRPSAPSGSTAFAVSRRAVLERLIADGIEARVPDPDRPPAPAAAVIVDGGDWGRIEGAVNDGVLVPQSRASGAVVETLAPRPGERVLDLCAGPGVKTTQIAAELGSAGAGLVADRARSGKGARARGPLPRDSGPPGSRSLCADASAPPPEKGAFDAVLVDPPCSGLGTLASRPDARWRRTQETIDATAELAGRILGRALEAVGPGGRIVYSTCTISRRENEDVVGSAGGTVVDLGSGAPALADAARPAIPADAAGSRRHRRVLHRPAASVRAPARPHPTTIAR